MLQVSIRKVQAKKKETGTLYENSRMFSRIRNQIFYVELKSNKMQAIKSTEMIQYQKESTRTSSVFWSMMCKCDAASAQLL